MFWVSGLWVVEDQALKMIMILKRSYSKATKRKARPEIPYRGTIQLVTSQYEPGQQSIMPGQEVAARWAQETTRNESKKLKVTMNNHIVYLYMNMLHAHRQPKIIMEKQKSKAQSFPSFRLTFLVLFISFLYFFFFIFSFLCLLTLIAIIGACNDGRIIRRNRILCKIGCCKGA